MAAKRAPALLLVAALVLALAALASAQAVEDRGALLGGDYAEDVVPGGAAHTYKITCRSSLPGGLPVRLSLGLALKADSEFAVHALASASSLASAASHDIRFDATTQPAALEARPQQDSEAGEAVFYATVVGNPAFDEAAYTLVTHCRTHKVVNHHNHNQQQHHTQQHQQHLLAADAAAAAAAGTNLVAAPAGGLPIGLSTGVPVNGSTTRGVPVIYSYAAPQAGCNVTVGVAALYGDPDLYAGPNANVTANYTYHSIAWGPDSVTVPNLQGTLYVAVVAFTSSTTYTVTVTADCPSGPQVVVLTSGVPAADSGLQLFQFTTSGASSGAVSIELTPTSGDPDLYVSVNRNVSLQSYDWVARAWGADSLTIAPSDAKFCQQAPCAYNILVVPFGRQDTEYSITATAGSGSAELEAGVPFAASSLGSTFQYYTVTASLSSTQDLTIDVTAQSGDPDLFVSTTVQQPNQYNGSTWARRYIGSDSLTIPHSDPHACYGCVYYVGVQCFGQAPCSYLITATFDEPVDLEDGSTLSGAVARGAVDYYAARAEFAEVESIRLTLSPVSGYCGLVVSLGSEPTQWSANWTTSPDSADQQLTIPLPAQPCQVFGVPMRLCVYYVGVYGYANCTYDLTYLEDQPTSQVQLDEGVPFQSDLQVGHFDYYSFQYLGSSAGAGTVRFRVTTLSGDPDLYVTVPPNAYPQPSQDIYNASSASWGDDVVQFTSAASGTYYVGVYGFTNTSYTIVADTESPVTNSVLQLLEDVPQQARVAAYDYQYFLVGVPAQHGDMALAVTCSYGYVSLYMSTTDFFPTYERYEFAGYGDLHVPSSSLSAGQYYVGAYASADALCTFTATTSPATDVIELSEGVAVRGRMPAQGSYTYYGYYHTGFTSVRLVLTPQGTANPGDTDLYVSAVSHRPNTTNYQWYSNSVGTEVLVIESTDPHFCVGCEYFIAAYAYSANCSYTLSATEIDVFTLYSGVPQTDEVQTAHQSYFNLYTESQATTVTLNVTTVPSNSGRLDVLVLQGYGAPFPSEQYYQYKATTVSGVATLSFSVNSGACNSYCTFKITVVGLVGAQYTITGTSN